MRWLVAGTVLAALVAGFGIAAYVDFHNGRNPDDDLEFAVIWSFFAAPSLLAAWLLVSAWWNSSGERLSTMDGPARLLSVAVRALPRTRQEWATAMEAELTEVRGRSARWWFAADAARAALFPPLDRRLSVFTTAAAAAVVAGAAFVTVGWAMPALQLFSGTLATLIGLMVVVAVARKGRIAPSPAVAAIVGIAVAGCIATTVYVLLRYPATGDALGPVRSVLLAAMSTGCLWIALTPPRALIGSIRAGWIGVAAGLALGAGFLAATSVPQDGEGIGAYAYMLLYPGPTLFVGSLLAAALDHSLRSGMQAAVLGTVTGVPLLLSIWLFKSMWWHQSGGWLLLANDSVPNVMAGNLIDAIVWGFIWILVWALPFGIFGAAVGGWPSATPSRRAQ